MIYLDHAAATPVSPEILKLMLPYYTTDFFNPSAAYLPAKKVAADYEAAKAAIAHAIGAKSANLIVTAGATEANNLAFTAATGGTSLYLATEHASVIEAARHFGGTSVDVDHTGRINLADLAAKITDGTTLISVALVNNETGVIQPLAEISALIRATRLNRLERGIKTPLYLHSDASQALNLLDVNVARLGVDLLTLNAAKVYGPKGIGALYFHPDVHLHALTYGGHQENGLRAGTENVPAAIGFAAALAHAKSHLTANRKQYSTLKNLLLTNLQGYELLNPKHALDNFLVLCYNGLDGERLIYLLEEHEIYVATGAACSASKGIRSHVLAAMGYSEAQIAGSLRLTLGATNTEAQILTAAHIINDVVAQEYRRLQNARV